MTTQGMEPLLLSIPEAAQLLGIGRSKTYELVATGELATVRIGRSVRVPRTAVEEFVDRLMGETDE